MPKETFLNLDKGKQDIVFKACVKEFSLAPFTQTSINQIIKNANISRGSFYQYFQDKEDCYMYVLSEIGKIKMKLIKQVTINHPNQSFFDHFKTMIDQTLQWIEKEPEYYMIGYWMNYDDSEFITKLMEYNMQSMDYFKNLIVKDQEEGLIASDIDVELLIRMIMAVNKDILMDAYRKKDFDRVKTEFLSMMNIIRKGVVHV